MIKKLSLFAVLLSLWAPAAWACSGTDLSVGHCCTTIGETRLSPDKTSVFACLAEVPNGNQGAWINTSSSGAPTGAVMAFKTATCPSGWSPIANIAGRSVVGSGSYTDASGTATYAIGAMGGERVHQLTIDEMPKHNHSPISAHGSEDDNPDPPFGKSIIGNNWSGAWTDWIDSRTGYTGKDGAHNNMQPFLALLYCQKD